MKSGLTGQNTLERHYLVTGAALAGALILLMGLGLKLVALPVAIFLAVYAYLHIPVGSQTAHLRSSVLLALAGVGLAYQSYLLMNVFQDPGTWDFLCFYLDGVVTSVTGNPYSPANYHQTFATLNAPVTIDPAFKTEILDVGFKYLPISSLIVLPFGSLSFQSGLVLWLATFIVLAGIAAIRLAMNLLPGDRDSLAKLGFAVALITLMPASHEVTMFQQTLFACLVVLLAVGQTHSALAKGVLAAVGLLLKPLMVIVGAYLIFVGNGRAVLVWIVSLVALCGLTALIVGADIFPAYLASDFVTRVPIEQYSESVNQSLLAFVIRTFDASEGVHPMARADFRMLAALVVGLTIAAAYVAKRRAQNDIVLSICLCGCLLIYPGTMTSYAVLLLLPLLTLITHARRSGIGAIVPAIFVTVIAGLTLVQPFVAFVSMWLLLILMAFSGVSFPRNQSAVSVGALR